MKTNSKKRFALVAAFALVATLTLGTLTACGSKPQGQTKNLKDAALEGGLTYTLNADNTEYFTLSDGYSNGGPFNVTWTKDNGVYDEDSLRLTITKDEDTLYGGEAKSVEHFGYGDFEVSMKPSAKYGSASTFFLYTGPTDDPDGDGEGNPHDEIDIEFLGKDTTKVQFNYFVGGEGGHEYWHDLGFDASEEYHTYGFRWAEDYIVWFVDGNPVYKVKKTNKYPMPTHESNIIMNYWAGTPDIWGWMGEYGTPEEGEGTRYQWVKTSAAPVEYNNGGDPEEPEVPQITFTSGAPEYLITSEDNATTITYTGVTGNYANAAAVIEAAAKGADHLQFTLKNGGEQAANVRADVLNSSGDHLEKTATMGGESARVDSEWGGCYFDGIPAGGEVTVTIDFDGTATTLLLYVDSATYGDTQTHSGSITVYDYSFTKTSGGTEPGEDPTPEEVDWTTVSAVNPAYGTERAYVILNNEDSTNVSYSEVTGNSYAVVTAYVGDVATGASRMRLVITNNAETTVSVRIDLQNASGENLEKTATMNGASVRVDGEWGGCYFDDIAAGATVEVIICFDGDLNTVIMFIDSANYTDTTTHSGNITLSGHKFA